jgi:CBS domain-containing protein
MKVKDVMTKKLVYVVPDDSAMRAARLMKSQEVGAVPVVRDAESMKLEGIVTDRDLCNAVVAEDRTPGFTAVQAVMHAKPVTCHPEDTLETCEKLMAKHQVRRIPVVEKDGRCVGIVAQADIVRHGKAEEVRKTLLAISKPAHAEARRHAAA